MAVAASKKKQKAKWCIATQLTMWINFTSFRIICIFFYIRVSFLLSCTGKCIESHDTHTRTYIENYSKRISANTSLVRIFVQTLRRHSVWCVMQRRWNQNESKEREKKKEATVHLRINGQKENSLKSIMPEIKCANQPQSKMITVFFRIAFFFAFNLSARQIYFSVRTTSLCEKQETNIFTTVSVCIHFIEFWTKIIWNNPIWFRTWLMDTEPECA